MVARVEAVAVAPDNSMQSPCTAVDRNNCFEI